jgi:hypothetical protein
MENRVVGPAIGLIVAAAIGGLLQVLSIISSLLGASLPALLGNMPGHESIPPGLMMVQGAFGVIGGIVGLAIAAFILYAAMKMKNLESHTLSIVAAVVAMVPCISPCCILGLPLGIWALVVLLDKDVKACFKS